MRFIAFLILFTVLNPSLAPASVWETKLDWSPRSEAAYQAWVTKKWDKKFFARSGPYENLVLDCADAVYSMRYVYAAENGLPFAMKDPTGGELLITNEMTRWDHLPPPQRKRAFLEYIFQLASTGSLPNDSYPVAIDRANIGAGRFLLTDPASHHSWTIKYLDTAGIPFLLFGSRPARSTFFERHEYPTMGFIFPKGLKPETHAGFRAFRNIEDIGRPVWEVPGYSLEQYKIPLKSWSSTIQKKLALKRESSEAGLARILENACRGARERNEMVQKAERLNRKLGAVCLTPAQFDDYSTPSRDARLKGTFQEFEVAYRQMQSRGAQISPELELKVDSIVKGDDDVRGNEYCTIQISPWHQLSLGQIYIRSVADSLSSNPHDSVLGRWGLERGPGPKARNCASH